MLIAPTGSARGTPSRAVPRDLSVEHAPGILKTLGELTEGAITR
ncbi:hypothetical protein ACWEQU_31205 [Streptomyces nodosus]